MKREQTLSDFNTFRPCNFCTLFCVLIVYGNLNRICILLLCERCINLNYAEMEKKNYAEMVNGAFQVYYILLLSCLFLLLIFDNFILRLSY